jgi:hypothetical protein
VRPNTSDSRGRLHQLSDRLRERRGRNQDERDDRLTLNQLGRMAREFDQFSP